MPFVSSWGGLTLMSDITLDKRNLQTGAVEEKGNGLQPLQLCVGKDCSYDPQHDHYKEQVWSGTPEGKKANQAGGMNWLTTPVWRVVTNRFKDAEWERFFAYYVRCINETRRANTDRMIWYQPDLVDVEIREYDAIGLQFPVKRLEYILNEKCLFDGEMTIFEESLLHSQVNRPSVKMMSAEQQKRFKKAFEYRKKQEANPAPNYDEDDEPKPETTYPISKKKTVA